MSTEFFNDQWRIPSNENQNKVSNYSMDFGDGSLSTSIINATTIQSNLDFSVSAWIKPTSNSTAFLGTRGLASANTSNGFTMNINSSGNLWARIFTETSNVFNLQTGSTISLNNWSHVAMTYDSSTKTLKSYLNGTEAGSMVGTDPSVASTNNLNIGRASSGAITYTYFAGKIDQVSVFNYTLSVSQVSTLYGGGTAVTNPMSLSPKPIAYYQLGDQSAYNGANYLVPNNSLDGYVFKLVNPNDGINVPASTDFNFGTGDFTISMWFKINSFASYPYLFDFRTPPSFTTPVIGAYISTVTYRIKVFDTGGGGNIEPTAGTVLQTGVWYNFIIKKSSGTLTTHFNGGSADQTVTNTSNFNTTPKLNIGTRHDNVNCLDGEMSNFQIFNTALPQTGANSIETIYNNGSPLASMSGFTSLVSWWKLNEDDSFNSATSTWTFNDYAGSNDGTSVSMDSSNLILSNLTKGTNGFSTYALSFDGVNDYLKTNTIPTVANSITISAWVKRTGNAGQYAGVFGVRNSSQLYGICGDLAFGNNDNKISFRVNEDSSNTSPKKATSNSALTNNTWTHVVGVADGTKLYLYINGVRQTSQPTYNGNINNASNNIYFGNQGQSVFPFNGQLSNCSRWNIALTQAQVTEIYNQGLPSDLNTFSGTAPIGWWQLGSNSSYNSGTWTCLDEIGTDNAVSAGSMTNDDITNGVGYSGNAIGGTSIEIANDAPYSTGNGLSENMDVLDRTTDVPS
jgi:hypothetical protein